MSRNTKGMMYMALIGAALVYAGAVVYGDVMFIQTVSVAFPKSGILGALALVGALVTALSALLLPLAMHFWFSPGLQFIWGIVFWLLDIAALSLNSMLAFQAASGGLTDSTMTFWRELSPATPMLAVLGWGIAFLLDNSHRLRHAQAETEADQVDAFIEFAKQANRSDDVRDAVKSAAVQAATNNANALLAAHVKPAKQLPAPAPAPIDYSALAAAILAQQTEKSNNGHKPETITLNSEGEPLPKSPRKQRLA